MPIFLDPPQHNPRGPDGKGWNRIAITCDPQPQCALRPRTEATFWESQDTVRAQYGNFLSCINGGRCNGCPKMELDNKFPWFGPKILIRIAKDGTAWAMNRPDDGWGEYGCPISWEDLSRIDGVTFERYRDAHGRGVMVTKAAP